MKGKARNLLENFFIVALAFYPLRHISQGLDLWDTGYHYANFQYIGMRHMDSMWLFSTYLSNVTGHLLTKLPRADTLMGMNLYTGLFASALALTGYFFCTRALRMPGPIAFAGEMTALSLCWSPSACLYHYLTYLFFLVSFLLLYLGLIGEKRGYLIGAGALLGANVLVRFPNLSEAAMILAVWAYDAIVWLEGRKGDGRKVREGFWRRIFRHTGWCFLGYAAALAVLLWDIHLRYGIWEYAAGIGRLFSMTETAVDYKPSAMILGIVGRYVETMYWVVRIGAILLGGMALFAAAGLWEGRFGGRRGFRVAVRALWGAVCAAMAVWLYRRNFFSFLYYSYDSIWHPGALFVMLAMLIAAVRVLGRGSRREERLLGGMLLLVLFLTPIGGNNGIFPTLNNLFVAAPYTLWESWRFLRHAGERRAGGLTLSAFPAKGVLVTVLALCLFQFAAFGARFVFAESTGVQQADSYVYNNPVLKNIRMAPDKAQWMTELSGYAEDDALWGKEVILYGKIPALSYYLQMPSAFNPWSDLDSYHPEAMEAALAEQEGLILEKGREKPVILLENAYAQYLEEGGGESSLGQKIGADPKWALLTGFLDRLGYRQTFRNEKFAVYR